MTSSRLKLALYIGGMVLVGATSAWLASRHSNAPSLLSSHPPATAGGKPAPLYYYDPMFPDKRFDQPGKSPFMDMQLVPKYPQAESPGKRAPEGSIAIDPRMVQTLGVRLATVETGAFARGVDATGVVAVDEHGIEAVQVRAPGWVEQLQARAAGDPVRRGQLLAAVYSPDLLATQEEFLIALRSGNAGLIAAARQRLRLFGLSDGQIARVQATRRAERRVNYFAPFDGYVMELGVRQGAAVQPGMTLLQLASLDTVWIVAELPEAQSAWIQPGDVVQAEVSALPGQTFAGRVDYLYPELMSATRTLKLRIVVANHGQHLRPGMFASVHLRGEPRQDALMIPTEAVIKTGSRSLVIVADDQSHFRPVLVRVGAELGGKSEILAGLTPGQRVVASGQFLIDSEASLRGAFNNLSGSGDGQPDDTAAGLMPAPSTQEH